MAWHDYTTQFAFPDEEPVGGYWDSEAQTAGAWVSGTLGLWLAPTGGWEQSKRPSNARITVHTNIDDWVEEAEVEAGYAPTELTVYLWDEDDNLLGSAVVGEWEDPDPYDPSTGTTPGDTVVIPLTFAGRDFAKITFAADGFYGAAEMFEITEISFDETTGGRKKKRFYIEVDDELVQVESIRQAREMLVKKDGKAPKKFKRKQIKLTPTKKDPLPEPVVLIAPSTVAYPEITPLRVADATPWAAYDQELNKLIAEREEDMLLALML